MSCVRFYRIVWINNGTGNVLTVNGKHYIEKRINKNGDPYYLMVEDSIFGKVCIYRVRRSYVERALKHGIYIDIRDTDDRIHILN